MENQNQRGFSANLLRLLHHQTSRLIVDVARRVILFAFFEHLKTQSSVWHTFTNC